MRRILSFLLIICVFALSTACESAKKTVGSNPLSMLTSTDWQLASLLGQAVNAEDFGRHLPFLHFDADGKLNGSTGCNNFTGKFQTREGQMRIDPGAMTKMGCAGNGEKNFLNALNEVASFRPSAERLELMDAGGNPLMELIPKE